ncbi:MAG: SGNH/GDSL hydrolase family protein [Clostridiales bacterium]|nr:SGNH/GDSL hydrolase family protein [Clostridiales bacterium]
MRIGKLFQTVLCAACVCGACCGVNAAKPVQADSADTLYSLDEMLKPVWEGTVSYQESALPVAGESGEPLPIQTLYPIKDVIKVQNAELTETYVEGVDYFVQAGKLWVYPDGAISLLSHEEMYPTVASAATMPRTGGGYITFHEGSWFHERQIVITYSHEAKYSGYIPEGKGGLLGNVREKLTKGNTLDLLVFGDSISVGGNASGFTGVSPYMPTYSELFAEGLKKNYGLQNVNVHNHSVGGKDSTWGVETIDSVVAKHDNIDLAIVAFGMNDGSKNITSFVYNINTIIDSIQAKFPQVDILAVATMLPNAEANGFYGTQESFVRGMKESVEREGVAVVNMTEMHASLLERKRYADMTGNNVNHANDYLSRVYAQTLLKTLQAPVVEKNPVLETSKTESGCGGNALFSAMGVALAVGAALFVTKSKKS